PPPPPPPPPPPSPPPPPPPPPSPPPPTPPISIQPALPPRCSVCISARLQPPPFDLRPYRYDNITCASIQQSISNSINTALNKSFIPMVSYFAGNSSLCSSLEVSVCGKFFSSYDAQDFKTTAEGLMPFLIDLAAGGTVCRAELEGYQVVVTTDGSDCLPVASSASCFLPFTPFPNCTCNTTQGILPFAVSPRYVTGLKTATTTEYCFTISTIPQNQVVPSACAVANDVLVKVEWYANQNMSSWVWGINLYPATGPKVTRAASWGAAGTNSLKATPINWTTTQANGSRVCVEMKNPRTMADLCLGINSQCYASTFNSNKDCCPIFRTGF
ncbi:hypothetical protein Vafri_18187, partial [Volvox africanus]